MVVHLNGDVCVTDSTDSWEHSIPRVDPAEVRAHKQLRSVVVVKDQAQQSCLPFDHMCIVLTLVNVDLVTSDCV